MSIWLKMIKILTTNNNITKKTEEKKLSFHKLQAAIQHRQKSKK